MRKNALFFVILFALCFAAVFPKTVVAAETGPQELAARNEQKDSHSTQPDQTAATVPDAVNDYIFNPATILKMIEANLSTRSVDESFFNNLAHAYLANPTLFCKTIAVLPANDILVLAKAVSYSLQKSGQADRAAIPNNCSDPMIFAIAKLVYEEVVNVKALSITEFVSFYDTVKRIDPDDIIDLESVENTETSEESKEPSATEKPDPQKSSVQILIYITLALLAGSLLGYLLHRKKAKHI